MVVMTALPGSIGRRWIVAIGALLVGFGALAMCCARASASVQAYPEPPYTNSATNHWWAQFTNPMTDGSPYYVCAIRYIDGAPQDVNGNPSTPGTDCVNESSYSTGAVSESLTEQPGHTYDIRFDDWWTTPCGSGCRMWYAGLDTVDPGSSILDQGKPTASVALNAGDAYTRSAKLSVAIGYADGLSEPFPTQYGGATYDCVEEGASCAATLAVNSQQTYFDAGCSKPGSAGTRTTTFACTEDLDAIWQEHYKQNAPDGVYYFCARESDAAWPDAGASQPNQYAATVAQPYEANVSDPACDSIELDRTAPQVVATADGSTGTVQVTEGDLVRFSAQATDASSGPSGAYDWDFGDNTSHGAGAGPSHTYTQAGTFAVRVTTDDRAGNSGAGTVTVEVNPPSSGGGGTGGGGTGGGGTGGGGTGGGGTGGGGTDGGDPTPTPVPTPPAPVPTPPSPKVIPAPSPLTLVQEALGTGTVTQLSDVARRLDGAGLVYLPGRSTRAETLGPGHGLIGAFACGAQPCQVTIASTVTYRSGAHAARQSRHRRGGHSRVRLRTVRLRLAAGRAGAFSVGLTNRQLRALARRRGLRLTVTFTVKTSQVTRRAAHSFRLRVKQAGRKHEHRRHRRLSR